MEDLSGRQFGHYQIVAPLGEGGMAAVYKAYQPAMERFVAVKVLPRQMAAAGDFAARFKREAKLLAQLQHPHILPVFDYGEADNYPYIVMPFVQSGTLADLMKKRRLSLQEIREIACQIGSALGYAHLRGMIHRDVKPSNVLIDESGNCLLTDFGLARMTGTDSHLTSAGTIMGTPAYMSPEQGGGGDVDGRSDLYALGVILYEMVTGRVPYTAETPIAIVFKHIQDPLPPARKFNPELSNELELVLLKALAKRPEERFQTAEDFIHAVQDAIPTGKLPMPKKVVAEALPVANPIKVTVPPSRAEHLRPSTPAMTRATQSQTAIPQESPFKKFIPLIVVGAIGLIGLVVIGGALVIFGLGMSRETPVPQKPAETGDLPMPPTLQIPAGIPFARITAISIDSQSRYVVEYQALEFSENIPGTHTHFFFNNVSFEQAGVPGKGPWFAYGGPSPFREFSTDQRPREASQLCVLVSNPNESVQANSGNCFPLPDVVSVTMRVDRDCQSAPGLGATVLDRVRAGQTGLLRGKSEDGAWFYIQNPVRLESSCWIGAEFTVVNGDVGRVPVKK
jgi:serine/threonine protein kinase